ncbi:MAG TPA: hypothetical protein VIJ92_16390 [Ginsengibacter sp.]
MSPYLKLTGRTFTIWLLASLINALLCGIFITLSNGMYFEFIGNILLVFICSLFFSAPGFFVFWVVLLFKISTYTTERALFRSALITGFILASITGLFGSKFFSSKFDNDSIIVAACVILSAMSSIMLHFKHFKKIK